MPVVGTETLTWGNPRAHFKAGSLEHMGLILGRAGQATAPEVAAFCLGWG